MDIKPRASRARQDGKTINRRSFIEVLGVTGSAAGLAGLAPAALRSAPPLGSGIGSLSASQRQKRAFQLKQACARYHADQILPAQEPNADESIANYIATYSKTLPHNDLGEVDKTAYEAFLKAVRSGSARDFEAIPMGGTVQLSNPQASYAFCTEGADCRQLASPPPPSFSSAAMAAEIVENYWLALTRDVPFADFGNSVLVKQAADELARMSDFAGPKVNGRVTAAALFRGTSEGNLNGPYISQFLLQPIPYGMTRIEQRYKTAAPGIDFLTHFPEWLSVQRGAAPLAKPGFDDVPRYIRNGRDMASFLHSDFTFQSVLNAALILNSMGPSMVRKDNPYLKYRTQSSFVTFGGPEILDWVARVTTASLKATWAQKWLVHRRIRPEEYSGRIHNQLTKAASYPLHAELVNSAAVHMMYDRYGTYLLPGAYPEGSPTHPSYPAGHAALVGAGVTMLKAFFDTSAVFPNPVAPTSDGLALEPYRGEPLTVEGELNKLANNVSLGRDTAGVHYRSDGSEGMRLGESVAISILHDLAMCSTEDFPGFTLNRFDGPPLTVCANCLP